MGNKNKIKKYPSLQNQFESSRKRKILIINMNNQGDREISKVIQFLKQSDLNQQEGTSPEDYGIPYVLSHIGRLFVKEFRIIEFLPQKLVLLSKTLICNHDEREYIIMKIQTKNKLKVDREYRLKIYQKLLKCITNLPLKGTYNALILYTENLSYSFLSLDDLKSSVTPVVNHLKYIKFYDDPDIDCKLKQIDCKLAGTILHALMQYYIAGGGWIFNKKNLRQLHTSRLLYNPQRAIHTVNYIIGLEMIKGDYEIIATQKLLETTNILTDYRSSFNRLDLVLRNQNKVLVIDWKFSIQKAKDYMKGYRAKVQNYLKLVKKYYMCEVEFHLYCIHAKDNGFMYQFSTETIHKRIDTVQLKDLQIEEDDDVWIIQSQMQLQELRKNNIAEEPHNQIQQPIEFNLSEKEISMCVEDYINLHCDQEIQKQIAQEAQKNAQEEKSKLNNLSPSTTTQLVKSIANELVQDAYVSQYSKEILYNSCHNTTTNDKNTSFEINIQVHVEKTVQEKVVQKQIVMSSQHLEMNKKITRSNIIEISDENISPIKLTLMNQNKIFMQNTKRNDKGQITRQQSKQDKFKIRAPQMKKTEEKRRQNCKPILIIDLQKTQIIEID